MMAVVPKRPSSSPIAASTREPFGKLVAVGVVTLLAGQAFLNIMVALRLFPVTGVTLPFVSYGGSSLVANYVLLALLMRISDESNRRENRQTRRGTAVPA